MQLSGSITDISFDVSGKPKVTLLINERNDFIDGVDSIKDKNLSIEIKKYTQRRSLNANAYAWCLIGKIGDKVRSAKDEVYLEMLKRYGQSEVVSVRADIDVKPYFRYYEEIGEGEVNGRAKGEIKDVAYVNAMNTNQLDRRISDCCCDLKGIIADVKYSNERNTCDIIRANQDNTRAILDYLTGEKISALQAENSGLKAQISNDRQSAYIVDALSPKCPSPAYVVQPPQQVTFPTNCCGTVNYANACGCGSF